MRFFGSKKPAKNSKTNVDIKDLINTLRHGNEPLARAKAANELGKIGGITAKEGLNSALLDEDAIVRLYALEALGKIGAGDQAVAFTSWRCDLYKLGYRAKPNPIEVLIEALSSSDSRMEGRGKGFGPKR